MNLAKYYTFFHIADEPEYLVSRLETDTLHFILDEEEFCTDQVASDENTVELVFGAHGNVIWGATELNSPTGELRRMYHVPPDRIAVLLKKQVKTDGSLLLFDSKEEAISFLREVATAVKESLPLACL